MRIFTLITVLFLAAAGVFPAGAGYEVDWDQEFTFGYGEVTGISLGNAADGTYFMSFVHLSLNTLESCVFDGTVSFPRVADLGSTTHAYSSLAFPGSLTFVAYTDVTEDNILYNYYDKDNGEWYPSGQQTFDTASARYPKMAVSSGEDYIVYSIQPVGLPDCFLRLAHNLEGPWTAETVTKISSSGLHGSFDIGIDNNGDMHLVWWDEDTEQLKHAVRLGPSSYSIEVIADPIVDCTWLELEYMQPNIPVVGSLQTRIGQSDLVRVAYELSDVWYQESVYISDNIQCVDMCLDPGGYFATPNWCFLLHEPDGFHCIHRSYPNWLDTHITDWPDISYADSLLLDWNPVRNEFGAFLNASGLGQSWFLTGRVVTPTPTGAPTGTPTPKPTKTPTPMPTKTPTPFGNTPSPTPSTCDDLGVTIEIPAPVIHAGDTFYCRVHACNPEAFTYYDVPLCVVLDVYGQLFFAPGFGEFDHYTLTLNPGITPVTVLPDFTWPSGAGTASGIMFYAGMTDPNMTRLFGTYDAVSFGWE